ncbi:MAG: carboxymethylenebutenolidase [Verrucomicrobia bacterium]|nr:MAG: carboxymethylenebutenolidase [Verrucomicrobiota bacterium]
MKRIVCGLFLVWFALSASAQDWAKGRLEKSSRHDEWVEFKSGERTIDQLAENGVIAIAPDLLSGQTYADIDGARKAISALPKEQVKADLNATSDYALTKIPAANGSLAVCGFCWGGGWAFGYASVNPKLKAAYSFYGVAVDNAEDAAKVPCPVYGFYAENDARVDETIPKAQELMKAAGKKYEPVIYKGAGHGFMREGESPTGTPENKKAREDAWTRWKTLLKELP